MGKWKTYKLQLPPDKGIEWERFLYENQTTGSAIIEAFVDLVLRAEEDTHPDGYWQVLADVAHRARTITVERRRRAAMGLVPMAIVAAAVLKGI